MAWIKDEHTRDAFTVSGNITCGWKDDNGLHRADHFVVNKFPRIREVYGDKPISLFIEFPNAGRIEDVVSLEMVEWAAGGMVRKCDKSEMMVFTDNLVDLVDGRRVKREKFGKYPCNAPQCNCKASADIICHVVSPSTGQPITDLIRIHNGSIRTVNNLKTMLKNIMSYGTTEKEMQELPRCFIWEIRVTMRKAKVGKTPTLEIKPAGWKQTRTANNLLIAAGLDEGSEKVRMIASGSGEVSGYNMGSRSETSENDRGNSEKKKSKNTEGIPLTAQQVFGEPLDKDNKAIESSDAVFKEVVDGWVIIKRLRACNTQAEFRDIMLDFNELNGKNMIGFQDLKEIKSLIRDWEEDHEQSETPTNFTDKSEFEQGEEQNSGRRTPAETGKSAKTSGDDRNKSSIPTNYTKESGDNMDSRSKTSGNDKRGSKSGEDIEAEIQGCTNMQDWGRLLERFNEMYMEFSEKQRIKTILFNKKQEINK